MLRLNKFLNFPSDFKKSSFRANYKLMKQSVCRISLLEHCEKKQILDATKSTSKHPFSSTPPASPRHPPPPPKRFLFNFKLNSIHYPLTENVKVNPYTVQHCTTMSDWPGNSDYKGISLSQTELSSTVALCFLSTLQSVEC